MGSGKTGKHAPPPKKKYKIIIIKQKLKLIKKKFNIRYESDGHIYIYIIHYFMYVFISAAIIEAREIESYV